MMTKTSIQFLIDIGLSQIVDLPGCYLTWICLSKTIDLYRCDSNIWFARICKNNWKWHCRCLICKTHANSHSQSLQHNVKWNFVYKVSVLSLLMQTFAIDNWNSTFSCAKYILRQNCKLNSNRNVNCQIARGKAENSKPELELFNKLAFWILFWCQEIAMPFV